MMKKSKMLRILSLLMVVFFFSSYANSPTYQDEDEQNRILMQLIYQSLSLAHYQPSDINDNFSKNSFDIYLKRLDYNKKFLLAKDVKELKKHEYQLDDEFKNATYEFFQTSMDILNQRIEEASHYHTEILAKPFDFDKKEELDLKPENNTYPSNATEQKEYWRKYLKYQTIREIYTLDHRQKKALERGEDIEKKSFAELEKEAREKVSKSQQDYFRRLSKLDKKDWMTTYINALTSVFDPHTSYFPAKDKENFDISLSGRFEGIGASLQEKDDIITVARIIPGGAAHRQGQLQAGDKIIKVGQHDQEAVDVVGWRLDKVVQLIRGKKGTEVRLTVEKKDGNIEIVPIERDVVILEETYAKSAILQKEAADKKMGYIHLPKFYADFSGEGGRSCAQDVKEELAQLDAAGVEGVILDLRNNGGGSLQDVVDMVGLFIENGPVVQVKSRGRNPYILKDKDKKTQFDKPLIVMVNGYSASASEILAAAIQDYNRGVIVGSPTFGKGTVQRFFNLDQLKLQLLRSNENSSLGDLKPLGDIKLTIQKFYRVNGGTTQLQGVTPDILLPNSLSKLEVGEKEYDYAMAWDEIPEVPYSEWKGDEEYIEKLRNNSKSRVSENKTFQLIQKNATRLSEQSKQSVYSLNWEAYIADQTTRREESKKYENIEQELEGFDVSSLERDTKRSKKEQEYAEKVKEWHNNIRKDIELYETVAILEDMIKE